MLIFENKKHYKESLVSKYIFDKKKHILYFRFKLYMQINYIKTNNFRFVNIIKSIFFLVYIIYIFLLNVVFLDY